MVWQDAWTGPEQGAAPTSTPPWRVAAVQPRSSRRTASVPPWVVAVVVVLCGVAALSLLQRTTAARPGPPEATSRLLPPVTTTAQGPYSVIATRADGQPVRWSPCRPIHWVYRPEGEPKYGRSTVLEAVAAVEAATGLSFVYDGDTTEVPSVDRPAQIPELYPGRYAPVLVAWATPEQVARFRSDGDAIGLARPHTAYGEHTRMCSRATKILWLILFLSSCSPSEISQESPTKYAELLETFACQLKLIKATSCHLTSKNYSSF